VSLERRPVIVPGTEAPHGHQAGSGRRRSCRASRFVLPDEVIEQLRSLGQLGTPELEAVRQQLAPAAPEAELK
jgi:hypothetical protein